MRFYDCFNSPASHRVRIALNLKGLTAKYIFCDPCRNEQVAADYLELDTQDLEPTLVTHEGHALRQSLAIIEWLEETHPKPTLLPDDPFRRAQARAFAYAIACEIHPLQNLKVLARLRALNGDEAARAWAREVTEDGLAACEKLIASERGPYCIGDFPTVADICLVPQLADARRLGVDIGKFPRLLKAETACMSLSAFVAAAPHKQPDAE